MFIMGEGGRIPYSRLQGRQWSLKLWLNES